MEMPAKAKRAIKKYHRAVRKIIDSRGCSVAEARAIYKSNGAGTTQTEHPPENFTIAVATKMMRRMVDLEARPEVAEYKRLLMAHSALTE